MQIVRTHYQATKFLKLKIFMVDQDQDMSSVLNAGRNHIRFNLYIVKFAQIVFHLGESTREQNTLRNVIVRNV